MSMILTIRHLSGSLSGKSQRIALQEGQVLRLGRAPENDVKFSDTADDSVSGFHAELSLHDGRLYIEDKRSSNGTFVNGAPCPPFQRIAVPDGSRIRLAKQGPEMQVIAEPAAAVASVASGAPAMTGAGAVAPPKESVGRATLLREIDRARGEERDALIGEMQKAKKSGGMFLGLGLLFVLLIAGGGIGGAVWWNQKRAAREKEALEARIREQQSAIQVQQASLQKEKTLWSDVEKKVSPAIVHIRCSYRVRIPIHNSEITTQGEMLLVGGVQGSGVLIRPGLVLTAKHVAEPWKLRFQNWEKAVQDYEARAEYDLLDVQFPGQQPISATFVAAAEQQDLALLQIQPTDALSVGVAKSNSTVNVTDRIAVVGYPADLGQKPMLMKNFSGFGGEWTSITQVTPTFVVGTVSQPLTGSSGPNYVIFDASVTHGNSGGAVVNERGDLIGIVSQKFQQQGTLNILGRDVPVREPVEAGNMAVSPDDIQRFLRSRGLS